MEQISKTRIGTRVFSQRFPEDNKEGMESVEKVSRTASFIGFLLKIKKKQANAKGQRNHKFRYLKY